MTPQQYRARIKSWGLTPCRPSRDGKTLHVTRTGDFRHVPDPEGLTPEESEAVLELMEKWFELGD